MLQEFLAHFYGIGLSLWRQTGIRFVGILFPDSSRLKDVSLSVYIEVLPRADLPARNKYVWILYADSEGRKQYDVADSQCCSYSPPAALQH